MKKKAKTKKEDLIPLSIRVSPSELERIQACADSDQRSTSSFCRIALLKAVERIESRTADTDKLMAGATDDYALDIFPHEVQVKLREALVEAIPEVLGEALRRIMPEGPKG